MVMGSSHALMFSTHTIDQKEMLYDPPIRPYLLCAQVVAIGNSLLQKFKEQGTTFIGHVHHFKGRVECPHSLYTAGILQETTTVQCKKQQYNVNHNSTM